MPMSHALEMLIESVREQARKLQSGRAFLHGLHERFLYQQRHPELRRTFTMREHAALR